MNYREMMTFMKTYYLLDATTVEEQRHNLIVSMHVILKVFAHKELHYELIITQLLSMNEVLQIPIVALLK